MDRPEQSEETFHNVTGPRVHICPRARRLFRADRADAVCRRCRVWWPAMAGYSATLMDLQLRWEAEDAETRQPADSVSDQRPAPDSYEWYLLGRWSLTCRGWVSGSTDLVADCHRQAKGVEIDLESRTRSAVVSAMARATWTSSPRSRSSCCSSLQSIGPTAAALLAPGIKRLGRRQL